MWREDVFEVSTDGAIIPIESRTLPDRVDFKSELDLLQWLMHRQGGISFQENEEGVKITLSARQAKWRRECYTTVNWSSIAIEGLSAIVLEFGSDFRDDVERTRETND